MRDDAKLCLIALVPEAVAGLLLSRYGLGSIYASSALFLHISAVALVVPTAHAAYSGSLEKFRHEGMGMRIFMTFFVPAMWAVDALVDALEAVRRRAGGRNPALLRMRSLEFNVPRRDEDLQTRSGGMREHVLGVGDSPVECRMRALLGLQSVQPRFSESVLRQILGDSCDDLRLLAYGMLDAKEKQISKQISLAKNRYDKFDDQNFPHDHYRAAKELSELHWEMVYQSLVHGDVRKHAIEQAQCYATEALKGQVYDGELRFFLGRIRLIAGDISGAESAFEAALALGCSQENAAPYLAECSYLKGDYAAVRKVLSGGIEKTQVPTLRHATEFWS